ncbi:MAG: Dabb family protein [Christensenellales bacterium]
MLKHVVCFKLKNPTQENCQKAREVLLSMKGNVEMIRDIQVGIDLLHSERSYDIILQVELDNLDALKAYDTHTYHVNVVKKHMHGVREASIAVDYTIE